jgi:ABC-type Fe3+-siderophore transport system permease subunit
MRAFLRRLRGGLAISLTWAAVWALIFAAIGVVIGFFDPDSIDPGEEPYRVALVGAGFGFLSGAIFSVLLATGDRRKKIRDLSLVRVALWGFLGTAVYPLLMPVGDEAVLIFGPVGAALAAGLVAIAKKAERGASAPGAEQPIPAAMDG